MTSSDPRVIAVAAYLKDKGWYHSPWVAEDAVAALDAYDVEHPDDVPWLTVARTYTEPSRYHLYYLVRPGATS